MLGRIHHVGLVTRDLAATGQQYRGLGYEPRADAVTDERQQLEIVFLARTGADAGEPLVELIHPLAETSPVYAFTTRNEYPIHHVCFVTDDIAAAVQDAKRRGGYVVQVPVAAPAIGGSLISFVYTRATGLYELVERPPF